jgi:glyoxylase-like metal-dependent hydrolase (beta-lactamase superfamily II)
METPEGRLLFSGDTIFAGGKVLVSAVWDCSPDVYARTLRSLCDVEIDGLYPGHGIWSVKDAARHLNSAKHFLDQLLLPPNLLTGDA